MPSTRVLFLGAALSSISSTLARPSIHYRRGLEPEMPYAPDTTKYCTWWIDSDGSMACEEVPDTWAITMGDFVRWNPSIGSDCSGFETGKSYCVEAYGEPEPTGQTTTTAITTTTTTPPPPPTTSAATTTTATGGAPGPTQTGQVANCNRWDLVQEGDSCDVFTTKYPGMTLKDLVEWNPAIGSKCENLWIDTYLCTGVTGWTPSTTTAPTATTPTPTNGISTPTPVLPGMVNDCDKFYLVQDGDNCATIAKDNGISLSQFTTWNPEVGAGCTGLWVEYYVCVSKIGSTPTMTTTTSTKPTNGITTPTPILPGMVKDCDKFHMVEDGDNCAAIAKANGISLSQITTWNPEVGADCTGLWIGYYVCVSKIGLSPTTTIATTTKPTNGITTPTPIQPDMVGNCDAFHQVKDGDSCAAIASGNGISLDQFYNWNPSVGKGCKTLWKGYYVCVSIVGVKPTTTAKPTATKPPGNGVATPTPIQPGMTKSCKKFHKVVSGDQCDTIAKKAGISQAQLLKWNPGVGKGCKSLWLGYHVCIAVL